MNGLECFVNCSGGGYYPQEMDAAFLRDFDYQYIIEHNFDGSKDIRLKVNWYYPEEEITESCSDIDVCEIYILLLDLLDYDD